MVSKTARSFLLLNRTEFPIFSFRDDLNTDEVAPLTSPRTAEPVGTGRITDPGEVMDISGGEIVPNATTTFDGQPAYAEQDGISRAAGLAAYFRVRNYSALGSTSNSVYFGWSSDNQPLFAEVDGIAFSTSEELKINHVAALSGIVGTYSNDTFKQAFVIARSVGYFYIDFDNEILLFVTNTDSTSPIYGGITTTVAGRAPFGLSTIRVSQLPAPWDTDDGIASDQIDGVVAAGTTFSLDGSFNANAGDGIIEFELTTLKTSGVSMLVLFRIQDASNHWSLQLGGAGAGFLNEVVAGTPTVRASSGAGTFADGEQVVIICDDEEIRVYGDNVLLMTYSSAANFKTEINCEVDELGDDGVISNVKTWPRIILGSALNALNAVANS